MKSQKILFPLIIITILSCKKEKIVNDVLFYSNDYETNSDLSDYDINTGEIKITDEDSVEDTNGCLNIFGFCGTPNLFKEIGPFDAEYKVRMEAWMKTQYGAAIHLNLKSQSTEYVRIENLEDLPEARKWNLYTSDELLVPKGESLMLYIDASNNTQSHTWIDELKIYGKPN